jgi:hypothetical protein
MRKKKEIAALDAGRPAPRRADVEDKWDRYMQSLRDLLRENLSPYIGGRELSVEHDPHNHKIDLRLERWNARVPDKNVRMMLRVWDSVPDDSAFETVLHAVQRLEERMLRAESLASGANGQRSFSMADRYESDLAAKLAEYEAAVDRVRAARTAFLDAASVGPIGLQYKGIVRERMVSKRKRNIDNAKDAYDAAVTALCATVKAE